MTLAIPLTQGKIALVDDLDADLAALRWCAHKRRNVYYAVRNVRQENGKRGLEQLHRVIANRMGIVGMVDHKNLDGLDCTRKNLRAATHQQNASNSRRRASKSGVKGVSWHKRLSKWQASIKVNYRSRHLGYFEDLGTARAAVEAERRQVHGAFARDE